MLDDDEDIEEQKQVFKQAREQVENNVNNPFVLHPCFEGTLQDIENWNQFQDDKVDSKNHDCEANPNREGASLKKSSSWFIRVCYDETEVVGEAKKVEQEG